MTNELITEGGRAYMKRALQLSLMGAPRVSPNPMVGAVIVAEGRIIGEGFHRLYGGPHAEVNAINSVAEADRHLLKEAVIYVTLEPCSHYGKTPPCAELIINTGIPKAVVAIEDPFLKDKASGIEMMRKAGIDVEVGLLREEAFDINRRFFTAHTLRRPYILLKWAQSADGFIAGADRRPVKLSTGFTQVLTHSERSLYDAIMVGTDTVLTDNPQLNCRLWPCRDAGERPLKVTFKSFRLSGSSLIEQSMPILKHSHESLPDFLYRLYSQFKVTALMVEGGSKTLSGFIAEKLYDEIRVETSPRTLGQGVKAPSLPHGITLTAQERFGDNIITRYRPSNEV